MATRPFIASDTNILNDDLVPNEERIDSCLLTDLNFDGIKEDVLFYLGSFGASGTKHFDACVWNPNTEHYDKIEEFKDIPNPKISDKYKCILSRVYVSSAPANFSFSVFCPLITGIASTSLQKSAYKFSI